MSAYLRRRLYQGRQRQAVEDGQFTLFATLSDTEMYRLQDRGITVEANF